MQFGAAAADLKGELTDRFAIDAGNARGGANAEAFGQGGDTSICLSRERMFMTGPVRMLWTGPTPGKAASTALSSKNGHFPRVLSGVGDRDGPRVNGVGPTLCAGGSRT